MLAQRLLSKSSIRALGKYLNFARYLNQGTSSYEGDGKTSVSIMNNELDAGLMINGFSQIGFRLNNGFMVLGPMAIFPRF